MKFVIFHGSFGHPEEHWFPILKKSLLIMGQSVIVPKYPCEDWEEITKAGPSAIPKNQNLESWFNVFDNTYKTLDKKEQLCFVGQSLGPLFILHVVEKYNIQLDSAIFACPFLSGSKKYWQADKVNSTFYKSNFDFEKLRKLIPTSYSLYSDNDPYVDSSLSLYFAKKMNSAPILIKGAGHINNKLNAPLITELCKTRLNGLYIV